MCEYFFCCFYTIEERFVETLKNLKAVCPTSKIDVKKSGRAIKKLFKQELPARHRIQHHEPFDDVDIDRIYLPAVMAMEGSEIWRRRSLAAYRKFSREWSRIAREWNLVMEKVMENVASVILQEASFLQFPEDKTENMT